MTSRKTLEEYQIADIAKAIVKEELATVVPNLITRGEYDRYTLTNDNTVKSNASAITTLQNAETDRQKDKKTIKYQVTGIAIGFVFQFVVWAVIASNGFKIGGQ